MNLSGGGFVKHNLGYVFAVVLLIAAVEFIARGPARAEDSSFDWVTPYFSTKAWLQGGNPYDHNLLEQLQQNEGDVPQFIPLKNYYPSAYPPTTFVILAPLNWLSWKQARQLLLVINLIATIATLVALAGLGGFKRTEWRSYLLWCFGLGFAPFHSGIAHGNLIILSVTCVALAVWAAARQKEVCAGGLLAVAIALKPQIGAMIWLAYAFQRRWRMCTITAVVWVLVAVVAVWQLEKNNVEWLRGWANNTVEFTATGSSNDPTSANRLRHDLINLQRLLHALIDTSREKVNALTYGFISCLLMVYVLLHQRLRTRKDELLSISALAVIGLLPVYHRFYDATLLMLPLAWSLTAWYGHLRISARLTLALILPFLFPAPAMFYQLLVRGYIPRAWAETWWWNALLMSHQVWLLLLLALSLLYALKRSSKYGDLPAAVSAH